MILEGWGDRKISIEYSERVRGEYCLQSKCPTINSVEGISLVGVELISYSCLGTPVRHLIAKNYSNIYSSFNTVIPISDGVDSSILLEHTEVLRVTCILVFRRKFRVGLRRFVQKIRNPRSCKLSPSLCRRSSSDTSTAAWPS